MSRFSKKNFELIIQEIEEMETSNQNIGLPIGILERMYDNYVDIDDYFHSSKEERKINLLGDKVK